MSRQKKVGVMAGAAGDVVTVLAANTNYPHSEDYILDRPGGFGDVYVLIHFLTPCEIGTSAGRVRANKSEMILYPPGFAQWNRGIGEPLRNNWLHFTGGAKLLETLGVPCNCVLRLNDDSFLEPAIQGIKMEIYQRRVNFERVLSLRLQLLLHELARSLCESEDRRLTPSRIAHLEIFRNLRALVLDCPEEDWSATRMAEYVHLSRSRFCVLYKEFFGSEPVNDLIGARLRKACLLLGGSTLTVEAVARQCGFQNPVHFYRLFRKRYHASPRNYCPNDAPYGANQHRVHSNS